MSRVTRRVWHRNKIGGPWFINYIKLVQIMVQIIYSNGNDTYEIVSICKQATVPLNTPL